jgi:hypothetical protein
MYQWSSLSDVIQKEFVSKMEEKSTCMHIPFNIFKNFIPAIDQSVRMIP